MNPELFVSVIYELIKTNDIDAAVDYLFEYFESMYVIIHEQQDSKESAIKHINEIIKTFDVNKLDTNIIVAILSITHSHKDLLPERTFFYNKVDELLKTTVSVTRHKGLLKGLEP